MRFVSLLLGALVLASPAFATCPTPDDMTKGVILETQSERGEVNRFVLRKLNEKDVEQTRQSFWISGSNTVKSTLVHGLFPTEHLLTATTSKKPVLKDQTIRYPGQNLYGIDLQPKIRFSLSSIEKDKVGDFKRDLSTTYETGRARMKTVAGCKLNTMTITGTELWGTSETVNTFLYFTDLGFGVRLQDKFPGRTITRKIIRISAAD